MTWGQKGIEPEICLMGELCFIHILEEMYH